ncbi:MAG: molybdopterin molybdotransferase MoeA [Sphaerobacter sp.]|nr:molybdopterin molybdotransferase MoeA [Sphaerobacter sp.]
MVGGAHGEASGARTRPWEDPEAMLGVDEARRRVLAAVSPLPAVEVTLLDAPGLVLAEDVVADADIPPFRNSAMDGYAVRAADVASATPAAPVRLVVVAEVAAGSPAAPPLGPGQAARIMTGAPLPEGADAVVRFEETDEHEAGPRRDEVWVRGAVRRWENVRHAGEDVRAGAVVLPRGTVLGPAAIGVLASLNRATVPVHRRPRVGILSTGDEVVDLGPPLRPGQIRNSNSYTLAALVREAGGEPILLGVARDRVEDIRAKLRAAPQVDFLITSGGVSIGDFDLVKHVLQAEGEVSLWQVRIKPGKPLAFGRVGSIPLLGLPGNPVAAYVAFLQFGRPALRAMLGRTDLSLPTLRARLLAGHENAGRRRHYVRGIVERQGDEWVARPCGLQGSGVLTSVTAANCLIVLPESWHRAEPGTEVEVQLLPGVCPADWP